ncbi:MAG: acetylglutamate kinase [Rhodospirillaceae bacterium TMED8]|nr:acetylglutamate kinase [Magnetovibrio sp.]OUT51195.1 MAG: acetylglutamate kinase [Rhodospirillaceae bacterium TMED8]|tara:strand:- start:431 stop:1348 length:918 start_codon:yes stop_codon:yes gene_type:complete
MTKDNININPDQPVEWFEQAKVLSEALPYMRRFTGKSVVIKYGGHAMVNSKLAERFARDIVLLRQVGLNPIVVHGGGPQIESMLDRLHIKSEFVDGLRITSQATMDVVEMVLSGSINKEIVSKINHAGGYAVGLSGKDGGLMLADRLQRNKRDPKTNIEAPVSFGLVGKPKSVNPHLLSALAESDITPVIAPIGIGPDGETLNINADTVAGAIATAVNATRLFMLTDVTGVLDQNGKLIPAMTLDEAEALIDDGTIQGGMIPKIENCIDVVRQGVDAATIVDGRLPHAVLVELFTNGGAGTQITR